MTNTIKLKRGSGSDPSASDMVVGEPVLRSDTAELFFKKDDGSVAKVSGGGGGGSSFQYLALRNAANDGAASYPGNDFTLVTSGTTTAVSPATANALILSYGGVVQKPNSGTSTSGITGFIVDGSRLKTATNFAAAPDFIVYQESGGIGEPSDNTVTEAKLNASNSPTNGYFLQAQSGNTGGLTWAAAPANDSSTGIDFDDNVKARWGTGNDLEAYFDGTHSKIVHTPGSGNAYLAADSLILSNAAMSEYYLTCTANGAVELYYDNVKRFETYNSSGVTGIKVYDNVVLPDDGRIRLGNSTYGDLQIFHDGSNSYINNLFATGDLILDSAQNFYIKHSGENQLQCVNDGRVALYYDGANKMETISNGVEMHGSVYIKDSEIAGFGNISNPDLRIYHDGSNSYIKNTTGNFQLTCDEFRVKTVTGSEAIIQASQQGSVELYYDNSKKLETASDKVMFSAHAKVAANDTYDLGASGARWKDLYISNDIDISDNGKILLGTGDDLQLYHNGSDSYLLNSTGRLLIPGAEIDFMSVDQNEWIIKSFQNGAVELYYDNSKKFHTTTSGAQLTGDLFMDDNHKLRLGTSQDLEIYHDGNASWINNTTEKIIMAGGVIYLKPVGTETGLSVVANNTTKLYYDNSLKFETMSTGCKATALFINTTSETNPAGTNTSSTIALTTAGAINGNSTGVEHKLGRNTDGWILSFYSAGGHEGGVSISGSTTTYNTSSDYRLKENEVAISDGITRVKQLKPYRFNFKKNKSKTLDGFYAHEAQAVVPESVTGTKDEVDSKGEPVIQGIDQSKLVPLLTAALQEAITKIETLETKVAALEGA